MKDPYHCPYCDQRSTRRWNINVHIKRKHGGLPGPYLASHPSSYKPTNPYYNIESTTVAASFQPKYDFQQTPVGISQYSAGPIYPPWQIIDHQRYGTGVSQKTTHKIDELKRLVYKYRQYQNIDPDEIVKWAINGALKGDTQFLDKKLEQLHMIEFSRSISS